MSGGCASTLRAMEGVRACVRACAETRQMRERQVSLFLSLSLVLSSECARAVSEY